MAGGEPVQILRVKDGRNVEFNERALEDILLADHVKDRQVVVISVAGAYRQGKSFLLTFLLLYLMKYGRPNWMGDAYMPPRGFRWRAGSTRETTGILVWNEVFLMTDSNGEKVAVLLMDTQGTFDCESTMMESTIIFALSTMISSVQIYNVMNIIKEDDLQHLQFFAEYGRLAQKEIETRPFQKLLFLIRDWASPQEGGFGYRGGRSFIASRLEIQDKQGKELKTLRQSIKSCFSDIDCFLMPHPGEKVAMGNSFDGRLADIKEIFRESLLQLVPSILAPENLLVKEINGRKLTCQELMFFFKAYVDVFKRGDLPEPTSMLLATVNATNVTAMEKARKCYMSGMTNRPRRNLDKLSEFHRELLAEAKKVFNDFPKMGGDTISAKSMDVLTKELEELFGHLFKEEAELIQIENEEEERRERERQEEQKREEQRERERVLEKEKEKEREEEMRRLKEEMAEEREALKREVAATEVKLQKMEEALAREKNNATEMKEKLQNEIKENKEKLEDLKKSQDAALVKAGLELTTGIVNGVVSGISGLRGLLPPQCSGLPAVPNGCPTVPNAFQTVPGSSSQ